MNILVRVQISDLKKILLDSITAEGYEEFTQQITADSDQIVQATLTPTGS